MSWWAPVASPAELVRYEAELNRQIGEDMAVLCLYDLSRFSAEAVADAVMTHPVVLVGDRVVANPWYVPPDDFLQSTITAAATRAVRRWTTSVR